MVATASPDTDEAHADSLRTHSVGGRPLKSSGIDTTSTIKPDEGISVQPSDIIESTGADSPGAGGDDGLTSLNGELTIHDCSLVERQQLKGLFKPGRDTGETRFQHTQGNQNLSPGGHFSSPDHVIILPGERSDRGVPNERSETTDACCVGTASILSGCDRVTSNSPDHHDRLPRHKCWNKQQVTRAFDHQDGKTTILKAGELSSSGSREKAKVRMEVTDQALVSSSLVDIFEQASVGNVDTTNDDDGSMRTELGSLTIRLCNLPSFAPVTSLAHNLRLMRDLVLDDCTISSLMGLERVLADSPCLQTLTLRCCRLYQLPQLESSSIRVLDLSYNSLKEVKGTETLCRLEKLNLSGNSIESLDGLRPLVPLGSGVLRQLDVSGNPVQSLPRYVPFCYYLLEEMSDMHTARE